MSLNKLMGGYNYDNPQATAYNKYQSEAESAEEKTWTGYNDNPNNTETADNEDSFYNPLPSETDPFDAEQITSEEIYKNAGFEPEDMAIEEDGFDTGIEDPSLSEDSFVDGAIPSDAEQLDSLEGGSGTITPPTLSLEDIKSKLEEVETLLKELKKDLPKSLEKKLKDELKKLEKMLKNEKTAEYSSDYINTELDNMYIQIMDAASGDLKSLVDDAKDKINDLQSQIDESKDLLDPKTYDQFMETLDQVEADLKQDPFKAQSILDGQSPLAQLITDLETAKTTPFAANTATKTVSGFKATYESESVDLKPNPNDDITEHNIVATKEVIIRAFNPGDHITINNGSKPGEWKVEYKHSNGEIENIIITQGSEMPVIKLDASSSQITDKSHINVAIGLLGKVQEALAPNLQAMVEEMNCSSEDFLKNVYKIYPEFDLDGDGTISSNDMNEVINKENTNFPPSVPNDKLFKLFILCDDNLAKTMESFHNGFNKIFIPMFNYTHIEDPSHQLYAAVRDHVVSLLQSLYSMTGTEIKSNGYGKDSHTDDLFINDQGYDIIDQDAHGYIQNADPSNAENDLYKYFVFDNF